MILGLPIALAVGFCSERSAKTSPAVADAGKALPLLANFQIEGDIGSAKKAGFTECTVKSTAVECVNSGASLLGIPVPAMVRADRDPNTSIAVDKARYSGVFYRFDPPHRLACEIRQAETTACDSPSPTRDLQRKLLAQGWKMRWWRGVRTYYHAGMTDTVVVAPANGSNDQFAVRVESMPLSDVTDWLEEIAKLEKLEAKYASE